MATITQKLPENLAFLFKELEELNKFYNEIVEMLRQDDDSPKLCESADSSIQNLLRKKEQFTADAKDALYKETYLLLSNSAKAISLIIPLLSARTTPSPLQTFTAEADAHRAECPMYIHSKEFRVQITEINEEIVQDGASESANWLNLLLVAFFEEWTESSKFQRYICRRLKKIYNKKRPSYIGEIEVVKVEMGPSAPQFKDFTKLVTEHQWEFFHEIDVSFIGEIKIELDFQVKVLTNFHVNIQVVVKSLFGRVQLYYCPSFKAKSWYSFIAEPAVNIGVEPIIGRMNKISLSDYPQVNAFIVNILLRKIPKYVLPNKRSIKIPKGRLLSERTS